MSAATVEGRPKTPLPMMEFTTSATRLQRPMARSSWRGGLEETDSIRAFVSQPNDSQATVVRGGRRIRPHRRASLAQGRAGLDSRGGCLYKRCGDLGTNGNCTVGRGEKSGAWDPGL